jgi:signal transduction histidine kinase
MSNEAGRILIVDDDEATRYVRGHLLRRHGYEIHETGRGHEGLALAEDQHPDLILLDVKLPDANGIDICRAIKSRLPQTIVLQTSAAFTGVADRTRALDGGADSYLVEPIEPDELIATVNALLRMRRAEQDVQRMNQRLEQLVAERSRELFEANQGLAKEAAERRAAEMALWHAQKLDLIGQLTGGIAHDFNNLLTVISGNLELVQNALKSGDDLRPSGRNRVLERLASAEVATGNAAKITQQLLAFARRGTLALEPVNLGDFLDDEQDFLRRAAGEAVTMDLVCETGLWQCETDPILLEAAILNLVVNARDAMPDGGSLLVKAANVSVDAGDQAAARGVSSGDYVQIVVSDTGHGMASEVAERAFEPFFTTKEAGKGSGLGLSQVYGFTKQSHGHVLVDSAPGMGTAVSLYLPRTVTPLEAKTARKAQVDEVAGGSETVLIVDDNELVRDTMEMMTESLGYRVLTAGGAAEALQIIGETAIDMLLSDIVMAGGISGLELAQRVRALRPNLPILMMSGYADAHADNPGDYTILRKPCRRDELARLIRRALNSRMRPRPTGTHS